MLLRDDQDESFLDDLTKSFLGHNLDLFEDPWATMDEEEEAPRLDFWKQEDDPDFWADNDYTPEWSTPEETQQGEETFEQSTPGSAASFQAAQAATMQGQSDRRWYKFENGRIPENKLVTVAGLGRYKPDAAASLRAMKRAARKDGIPLRGGGYRSYEEQEALQYKEAMGIPVAEPGHSNHGWGTAADFDVNDPKVFNWLQRNAGRFGWENPEWAQNGVEPWHWEFSGDWEGRMPPKPQKVTPTPNKKDKPRPEAPTLTSGAHALTEPGDFVEGFLSAMDEADAEVFMRPATTPTRGKRDLRDIDNIKKLAKTMMKRRGLGEDWRYMVLIMEGGRGVPGENAGWNPKAKNQQGSSAIGLPQRLESAHPFESQKAKREWLNDPVAQLRWMIDYVLGRYGSFEKAWQFKLREGTY